MGDDGDGPIYSHSSSPIPIPIPIPKKDPHKIARQYQVELSKRAVDENVIVVLETGCGKTLIAILLMCQMSPTPNSNSNSNSNSNCVFLAPTVVLVQQQARVIEEFTDFKVGVYCGDSKHLNTHSAWDKELHQHQVLVMTPQVLLRCLCHCFIKMHSISLLIFDECHYAQLQSNHPYAEIMKVFYKTHLPTLPRIFGMTASPICGKGASINSLEALLHAKVYTVNNKNKLESVIVSPVVQVYHYSSNIGSSTPAYQKCLNNLEEIKRQCFTLLCRCVDNSSRLQDIKKLLQRLHNNMVFCLTSLGLWGALQACQILLNGDVCERTELIEARTNTGDDFLQNDYLVQTASLLKSECMRDVDDGIASDLSHMKILEEPYFSQKVLRLIEILSSFRSRPGMKCIIFVNRIIVARSLSHILGQIKILSAWNCDFLVGVHSGLKRMSRKTMNHILEEFRSGKLNLLVATKVGEEGLDIQTCCLVIRFDLPETLASFIQSRGRARMPQSEYAFLVDSGSEREMSLMDSFKKNEDLMNIDIRTRKSDGVVADIKEEVYSVGLTGATISTQTSVSLLYHYCSKLPRDEYFNPKPRLFYVDDTEGNICHIILPSNAPIHHIMSVPQSSIEAAKKDACLKACKELHQIGALTKYLLREQNDLNVECVNDLQDSDDSEDEDSSFVLQEMLVPAALKEPFSYVDIFVHFNSYFIRFSPKPQDRQYKDFGLFVKAPLPCEAEEMKIDLHLSCGRSVLTDLIPSGAVEFNQEEMFLAHNFQKMCFKIILDRTEFMSSNVLLKDNEVTESNFSSFYFLLPVIRQQNENNISVDWTIIKKCLSSPIFSPAAHEKISQTPLDKHLHLADGPTPVDMILNSLVYVVHKNSFFFVSQIFPDKNGYSLLNNSTSHVEHLREKFEIHLVHPEQPLLQAKQLFCLRNLLHDRKKGNDESLDLEEHFFELPPEVCQLKIIGFSKDIGSSLSLLPSIMHRLENLLVAIELKDMLSKSFPEGAAVSAERVLEAITTEKCHERFSLERLEVLGDAFLKFAVGRHLFLKHEAFDEGQLTRKRSNAVKNSNLCRLAIMNRLQVYIRDEEFDPRQFFALGHPCPIICTKQTEKQIHTKSEANLKDGTDSRQVRCSKHHHWLSKKTIADVVEALVGAYVVDSGFKSATAFLIWIGIQTEFDVSAVCRAWIASENFLLLADSIDIPEIEDFLGHVFVHKGLLLQAFIHPSYNQHGGGCYQRLEFLGDAILDYLITSYLFSVFPDLKPGQLTDLRSSLVNNNSFARVAACRSLHKFIICESGNLCNAINKYVDFIKKPVSERVLLEEPPCPKALGDLVESCIGAILLDVGFDLNQMWNVMLSFLEPIMGFSNWQLSPIRELFELGHQYGLNVKFIPIKKDRSFVVEAIVDGRNFQSTTSVTNRSKRMAKRMAAEKLTAKLKAQGYKLKTKSLAELLKSLRKMEGRLIGYDELPVSALIDAGNLNFKGRSSPNQQLKYASPILPDNTYNRVISEHEFTNSRLEDCPESTKNKRATVDLKPTNISYCQNKNSSNCVISEPNFANFSSEDCTNGLKNVTPTMNPDVSIISGIHKKIPRAGPSILKISEQDRLCKTTAKSRLHEICIANCWRPPLYECCKEEGPSHLKMFTYKVVIVIEEAGDVLVECFGRPQMKKKVAAEEAAEGALWFLQKEAYIP